MSKPGVSGVAGADGRPAAIPKALFTVPSWAPCHTNLDRNRLDNRPPVHGRFYNRSNIVSESVALASYLFSNQRIFPLRMYL